METLTVLLVWPRHAIMADRCERSCFRVRTHNQWQIGSSTTDASCGRRKTSIRDRPALSRWHPGYKDEFAEFLTLEAPFRR